MIHIHIGFVYVCKCFYFKVRFFLWSAVQNLIRRLFVSYFDAKTTKYLGAPDTSNHKLLRGRRIDHKKWHLIALATQEACTAEQSDPRLIKRWTILQMQFKIFCSILLRILSKILWYVTKNVICSSVVDASLIQLIHFMLHQLMFVFFK